MSKIMEYKRGTIKTILKCEENKMITLVLRIGDIIWTSKKDYLNCPSRRSGQFIY